MHRRINYLAFGGILVYTLFSANFFDAKALQNNTFIYIRFFVLLVGILISAPFFFIKERGFTTAIQLLCISMVLSVIPAKLYWGQDYIDTVKRMLPYLVWFFYFFLRKLRVDVAQVENIVMAYGVIYAGVFMFQFVFRHTPYFGWADEFAADRGIERVFINGSCGLALGTLIALSKIRYSQGIEKVFYISYASLGTLVLFLSLTRVVIFSFAVIYTVYFLARVKLIGKIALLIVAVIGIALLFASENVFVSSFQKLQGGKNEIGEKNIRLQSSSFFVNDFAPNIVCKIIGNGVPYTGKTKYGLYEVYLGQRRAYFLDDVGLLAVYAMFGIFAFIAYMIILGKSLFYKVPGEYQYFRYFAFYLIGTCVTTNYLFGPQSALCVVFFLYNYQSVVINYRYPRKLYFTLQPNV